MANEPPKRSLFLVWRSGQDKSASDPDQKKPLQTWMQLDLFPNDRPDALIFTTASRKDLPRITALISRCNARSIIDLRELPSLKFENKSRDFFFALLSERGVNYEHFDQLVGGDGSREGISSVLKRIADGRTSDFEGKGCEHMRRLVEHGPTIVLTDTAPETDAAAASLTESLWKSKIKFSPVFATEICD